MSMSRTELKSAFREAASREFREIPATDPQIPYTFSFGFEEQMESLLKHEKKFTWRFTNTSFKRSALVTATTILLLTTACSVPAIREPVVEFIREVYETHFDYSYSNNARGDLKTEYYLSYLPEGFTESGRSDIDGYLQVNYKNDREETIAFSQFNGDTDIHVGKKYTEYRKIDVNGQEVHLHIHEDTEEENPDRIIIAIWITDTYYFDIVTHGDISEETIIKMIEGVAEVES